MKQFFLLLISVTILFACTNKNNEQAKNNQQMQDEENITDENSDTSSEEDKKEDFKPEAGDSLQYQDAQYAVTSTARADNMGYDFHVYNKKSGDKFDYKKENIKNTTQLFYIDVIKNYLILDDGTGPYSRDLFIIDMSDGNIKQKYTYCQDLEIKDNMLYFYEEISTLPQSVPKPKCEGVEGLVQYGYAEKCVFDFSKVTKIRTGEYICLYS